MAEQLWAQHEIELRETSVLHSGNDESSATDAGEFRGMDVLHSGDGVSSDAGAHVHDNEGCLSDECEAHCCANDKHRNLLSHLLTEWATFESSVRLEAEFLALGISQGEDEWWNETLERAEGLEGYANMFSLEEVQKAVGAESVVVKVRGLFGEQVTECDADGIVDSMLVENALTRSSSAYAGAWVLMLGQAGGRWNGDESSHSSECSEATFVVDDGG